MTTRTTLIITNKKGIHARPAATIVKLSQDYDSNITLVCRGKTANAGNMMSILMLAAAAGDTVELIISGADSEIAMSAMTNLFATHFQEDA